MPFMSLLAQMAALLIHVVVGYMAGRTTHRPNPLAKLYEGVRIGITYDGSSLRFLENDAPQ